MYDNPDFLKSSMKNELKSLRLDKIKVKKLSYDFSMPFRVIINE